MAVKVKPNESQEFKEFEVDVEEITWKKRCELNDLIVSLSTEDEYKTMSELSICGDIVLKYTKLDEEELNNYSTDEIIAIANTIFEFANKKKS